MSAINSVFAEAGINIGAQFLQTDEAIGYVVIDVSADSSEEAMDALQGVAHTIKVRRLF